MLGEFVSLWRNGDVIHTSELCAVCDTVTVYTASLLAVVTSACKDALNDFDTDDETFW